MPDIDLDRSPVRPGPRPPYHRAALLIAFSLAAGYPPAAPPAHRRRS